jgi:hypothetical protein
LTPPFFFIQREAKRLDIFQGGPQVRICSCREGRKHIDFLQRSCLAMRLGIIVVRMPCRTSHHRSTQYKRSQITVTAAAIWTLPFDKFAAGSSTQFEPATNTNRTQKAGSEKEPAFCVL